MNIQPVSTGERNFSGKDYFLFWAGVAISLAEIWAGGFLASMGFWAGFWAIIIGHVIGNTFMSAGGVIGSDHGIMSMVSVRPSFGIRGSNLAAVLNIIQLIGWASIMLIIAGSVGASLGEYMGGIFESNRFWILLIGVGTLLWALFTGKTLWKLIQSTAVISLLLVIVLMTWIAVKEFGADVLEMKPAKDAMPFMTGLDIVIAMPISWMPLVADYARFSRNTSSAFWNTWWGYFIVSSWMYLLGLTATIVTGNTDPGVLILDMMGKIGLAIPALVLIVLSTITSDFPDIYSAACSMMNISDKLKPNTMLWGTGAVSILAALVFPMSQYENFLLFIGAMFIPLFGVVMTDYFLIRKRKLDMKALYASGGGAYWYAGGYNPVALISWAAGFILYQLIAHYGIAVGGSVPSFFVAGMIYYVITKKNR